MKKQPGLKVVPGSGASKRAAEAKKEAVKAELHKSPLNGNVQFENPDNCDAIGFSKEIEVLMRKYKVQQILQMSWRVV